MAFRRRRFRSRGKRRKLVWSHHNEQFAAGTSGGVDLLNDFRTRMGLSAGPPGITIARIRGTIQFSVASPVTLDVASGAYVGIIRENRQETSATIQKPLTVPNDDWMYREWVPFSHFNPINSTVANSFIVSHAFDIKSMRKLEEIDQSLFFAWEATGGLSIAVFYDANHLLMMP